MREELQDWKSLALHILMLAHTGGVSVARYFFNLIDGSVYKDADGTECPTVGHARREAAKIVGYSLMSRPQTFWNGEEWTVEVTRKDGTIVFRLSFRAQTLIPDEWIE